MNTALLVAGSAFLGLAALIHVYIFIMESLTWTKPATWKRFGLTTQQDAETTKPMAYNQGFYNLFLAIGVVIGIVLLFDPATAQAGAAFIVLAAGSMVAAATVLVTSNPKLAKAAATQGAAPLVGLVLVIAGLLA